MQLATIAPVCLLLAATCLAASAHAQTIPTCNCANASLCKPLPGPPTAEKELFMFVTRAETNWQLYPWDDLTTVAVAGWTGVTTEMVCHAHSTGTRLVILTSMSKADVPNATARAQWVQTTVANVMQSGLDGVNVDFEDEVLPDEQDVQQGLISLTKELKEALDAAESKAGGTYQLSWDFAWNPFGFWGNCGVDERCYPYQQLAAIVDVGFVMSYDMRSQVFGSGDKCFAGANSPQPVVGGGLKNWTSIAAPGKLVLGLPLYGYRYECLAGTSPSGADGPCQIAPTDWRNATCSDAVGREFNASIIAQWLDTSSSSGRQWDEASMSPWFNMVNASGAVQQVWYDDAASLALKAQFAGSMGLLGTGSWQMDSVLGPGLSHDLALERIRALQAW
jgi:di-N-acetylchitobiase